MIASREVISRCRLRDAIDLVEHCIEGFLLAHEIGRDRLATRPFFQGHDGHLRAIGQWDATMGDDGAVFDMTVNFHVMILA